MKTAITYTCSGCGTNHNDQQWMEDHEKTCEWIETPPKNDSFKEKTTMKGEHVDRVPFTQIENTVICSDVLSFKAKGVYAILSSFPDDWETSHKALARLAKESEDTIKSGIKELQKFDLVWRERMRRENGELGYMKYYVRRSLGGKSPCEVGPRVVEPCVVSSPPPNTKKKKDLEESKTNKTKKDKDMSPTALFSFEEARQLYKAHGGRVRGQVTEYETFVKACRKQNHHPKTEVAKIRAAIGEEHSYREACVAAGVFVPPWKNFSTWLNQCCWLQEFPEVAAESASELPNWKDVPMQKEDVE